MKPGIIRTILFCNLVVSLLIGGFLASGNREQAQKDPFTVVADPITYKFPGDNIRFIYTLKNTMGTQIYNLKFTDRYGKVPCYATLVEAYQTTGCYRQITITQDDIANGHIDNSVSVTGDYNSGGCFGYSIEHIKLHRECYSNKSRTASPGFYSQSCFVYENHRKSLHLYRNRPGHNLRIHPDQQRKREIERSLHD